MNRIEFKIIEENNLRIIAQKRIKLTNEQAEKFYDVHKEKPFFKDLKVKHWDTLILSRFYHPNLSEIDLKRKWRYMPARLYGSHSLEAWGYRLKCFKGEFGKHTDWKSWSPEMQEYCKQDVVVLTELWHHFQKFLNPSS